MKLFYTIMKSSDYVFDYLTDMQKFVSVHPVITKIQETGADRYIVYETLKFGFIPFSFSYPVTIERQPLENMVIMHATVMKFTKIEMTFILKAVDGSTLLEENILFKSPLPITSMLKSTFKKQHQQLFKNIELAK